MVMPLFIDSGHEPDAQIKKNIDIKNWYVLYTNIAFAWRKKTFLRPFRK